MLTSEIERLKNRFLLCRNELVKAKSQMVFWSRELGYVVDLLKDESQISFDFFETMFKKELKDEVQKEDGKQAVEKAVF